MLTRLEVTGFKNLVGLRVDFGPFNCIAGPNGTGKSNVFDAIHFLSLLAEHPIVDAAQRVRSAEGRTVDPRELFWTNGSQRASTMSLAVEMIVSPTVTDDFGRRNEVTSTFLRYELRLGYEPPSADLARLGRLVLLHEELSAIDQGEAREHVPWASKSFLDAVVQERRAGAKFISTEQSEKDGTHIINIHQDAGSRGPPRPSAAETAPRTVVCTTTTESEPTILAARREMQSWRMLALEPTAMRTPDSFAAKPSIEPNGGHMAAALYRLANQPHGAEDGTEVEPEPRRVYASVTNRLARLIDAREIRVDRDDRRDLLTVELRQGTGGFLPARSLSDGTLRFLVLSILDADPEVSGLLCMEEPENGIHPERLPAMVELLQGIAVDPTEPPSPDNPLRQVIVNTHSPGMVQLQRDDLLFAKTAQVRAEMPIGGGMQTISARVLRLRPLRDTRARRARPRWRRQGGDPRIPDRSVRSTAVARRIVARRPRQWPRRRPLTIAFALLEERCRLCSLVRRCESPEYVAEVKRSQEPGVRANRCAIRATMARARHWVRDAGHLVSLAWTAVLGLMLVGACAGEVGIRVTHPGASPPKPEPSLLVAVFSGTLHDTFPRHYRHDMARILLGAGDGGAEDHATHRPRGGAHERGEQAGAPALPPSEAIRIVDMLYPSVGRPNRNFHASERARTTVYTEVIEQFVGLTAEHPSAEVRPEARVVLFGFSQGGCIALGELLELATHPRAAEILPKISVVLVAPAGDVIYASAVARRMENACREADARLTTLAFGSEALRRLLRERLWILWGSSVSGGAHDGLVRRDRGPVSHNLAGIRSFMDQEHEASFRWQPDPEHPKRQRRVQHGQWVRPLVLRPAKRAAIEGELRRVIGEAATVRGYGTSAPG